MQCTTTAHVVMSKKVINDEKSSSVSMTQLNSLLQLIQIKRRALLWLRNLTTFNFVDSYFEVKMHVPRNMIP